MARKLISKSNAAGAAFAGVLLLAAVAPFEVTRPLLRLPWQSISNLEAALLLACAAWGVAVVADRRAPAWRTPTAVAWMVFVCAMAVSALAAAAPRANALHMAGRFAAALAVYGLTINGVTTRRRLLSALAVSLGAAVVVALLAVLEYAQVDRVLTLLRAFRPGVTAVGAQLRAGGPLQYPTIASMYLEVVFALGLGLLLAAVDGSRRVLAAIVFASLALIAEAITLTFTRAGLITMAASLVLVAWGRRRQQVRVEPGLAVVAALAVVVLALFVSSRSTQSLWLRLTSEAQDAWYRAAVDAPPTLAFATDETAYVPISVRNDGRLVWDSREEPAILLSYHWLLPDGSRVVAYEGARTAFAAPVSPGDTAVVRAKVRAPRRPGAYRLTWDLVQEGHLWFSTEPGAPAPATSAAVVDGVPIGGPLVTTDLPRATHRPGRFVLWRAALQMAAAHPLLGVGPDNFRLQYGSVAGISGADTRTHSNNMYLEVLAGGGLLGLGAFCYFLRRAGVSFFTSLRPVSDPHQTRVGPDSASTPAPLRAGAETGRSAIGFGIAAAGVAIALHGVVDSFLGFAPTYILFALTLGFADAHRV